MGRIRLVALFTLGLCRAGISTVMEAPQTECPTVAVHVSNLAHVAPHVLTEAEGTATAIFRQAGLGLEWRPYKVSSAVRNCPVDVIISIVSRPAGQHSPAAFGYSEGRVHATVLYDRVLELADSGTSTAGTLALAMAHEIGHLLLGPESHSAVGVMRSRWTDRDLKRIEQGALQFTQQQRFAIRAEVTRRSRPMGSGLARNKSCWELELAFWCLP